jgi:RAB protein geranylgeranyltransferase component A
MPSRGTLIDALIASDVSKYVEFKLLNGVHISSGDGFQRVPGSKEDVFKDKSISRPEKLRLMKALKFAAGEFEADPLLAGKEAEPILPFLKGAFGLSDKLAQAIAYALAFAGEDEPALPALRRARRYLRSMGRYGPSPFLVGLYGGAGEVAQGFCR